MAVLAAGLLLFTGCEKSVLDVSDSENVTGEDISEDLDLLVNRAFADFQVAYSGGGLTDRVLSATAVFSDEFMSAGTFTTRTKMDQRDQFPSRQGNTGDLAYGELHDARVAAVNAADAIEEEAGQTERWALMRAFEGFSLVALAENYCGAVPLSTSSPLGPGEEGEPRTTSELFNLAAERFGQAASAAPGGSDAANLAAVGEARAQLGLGNISAAASAVSGVPTSFVFQIEHSDNTGDQENPIFNLQLNGRYSVANGEGNDTDAEPDTRIAGGNGVPFHHLDGDPSNVDGDGVPIGDPRVPWAEDPTGGFDASIPLFLNLRYVDRNSGVVLADGVEARLIEAEADIQNGAFGAAEDKLNALRADVQSLMAARYPDPLSNGYGITDPALVRGEDQTLDPLTLPANQADAVDVLFKERAFWLFNTGHRLADMRRLARAPYSRPVSDVFPTGDYFKGGDYGDDVAFWVDFDETNNPNFSIDQCDITVP